MAWSVRSPSTQADAVGCAVVVFLFLFLGGYACNWINDHVTRHCHTGQNIVRAVSPRNRNSTLFSEFYLTLTILTSSDRFMSKMFGNVPPPAVICAENIALLYLLHQVPTLPSSNEASKYTNSPGSYSLSFSKERELSSTLAFLSNTKDDPNHIPALCVEEDTELGTFKIMLAVNKARWDDGNDYLRVLEQNCEKILSILSGIPAEQDSQSVEHHLFTAIVDMCRRRLLIRLRFKKKSGGTPKQSLRLVLGEAMKHVKQLGQHSDTNVSVEHFKARAKDVIRLADLWEKHQKQAELENLVEGVYRLKQVGHLQVLMDTIPDRLMVASSRSNLVNIVNKVSRYREAARFLYRAAKRYPQLGRAKVVLVNLPRETFNTLTDTKCTPHLRSAIARARKPHRDADFAYLCQLLKKTPVKLNDEFTAQTKKTLREAKIHAEIQLVLHYELNATRSRPRVVCSSKDACFLCNTFIAMHGKMHTPGSHGRLYPGWKLPSMPIFMGLDQRFNERLEYLIGNSLNDLLSRRKKTKYPDPNESTVLTLQSSRSTFHRPPGGSTIGSAIVSEPRRVSNDTIRPRSPTSPQDPRVPSILDGKAGRSDMAAPESIPPAEENPTTDSIESPKTQLSHKASAESTRDALSKSNVTHLVPGMKTSSRIERTSEPHLFVAGGNLEVYLDYTPEPEADREGDNMQMSVNIECLSDEEALQLRGRQLSSIVDVESLDCRVSHCLEYQGSVLLAARKTLVRITSG